MIKEKFYHSVKEHKMFSEGDSVVAAVSGGADSVCLFSLLLCARKEMGITVNCVHVNHNLRQTAKRDEAFVRAMCEKNGVLFFLYSPDIAALAAETGQSEETCGRNERYKFFFETAKKTNSSVILTAHNKNDSAETVLMNLMRGSGTHGMRGIPPLRKDGVGRPLIEVSREEIEEYLKINAIPYMEDETNREDKYTRNYVRLRIFPLMKFCNPSVVDAVTRAAKALSMDDDFISDMANRAGGVKRDGETVKIFIKALHDNPVPVAKRIVMKALREANIEPSLPDIEAILSLSKIGTGKKHIFPCKKIAYNSYDSIIIETPCKKTEYAYPLVPEQEIYIEEIGKNVLLTRNKPSCRSVKIKAAEGTYEVRSRRDGDRFSPYNMTGTKKLKDYFIDEKIPQNERWKVPVITCNGNIAAVGNRVDNSFFTNEDNLALFIIIR